MILLFFSSPRRSRKFVLYRRCPIQVIGLGSTSKMFLVSGISKILTELNAESEPQSRMLIRSKCNLKGRV